MRAKRGRSRADVEVRSLRIGIMNIDCLAYVRAALMTPSTAVALRFGIGGDFFINTFLCICGCESPSVLFSSPLT